MATVKENAADLKYALIAKRYGMKNSLRIAYEARAAGIKTSLAFAVAVQETGDRDNVKGGGLNVFGHDQTIYVGAGPVTKTNYHGYLSRRGHTHMQGVGPFQLTWWEFQDAADRLGGCWIVKYNARYAMRALRALIKDHGEREGVKRYNGTGPAAEAYVNSVLRMEKIWHKRLYGS